MTDEGTRRAELVAGALAGDLTADEHAEFERAADRDPSMRTDLAELRELTDRLGSAGLTWHEEDGPPLAAAVALPPPDDELAARRATSGTAPRGAPAAARRVRGRGRRRPWLAGVAAGLLLVGAAGGIGVRTLTELPPSGPPGTLGAVEPVALSTRPASGAVTASLVAHTWGTETVLEIDGLAVGETYDVVLVDGDDRPVDSGAFLGSRVTITCRMNAPVLRQDVTALQIRDDAGQVVAAGSVPVVR